MFEPNKPSRRTWFHLALLASREGIPELSWGTAELTTHAEAKDEDTLGEWAPMECLEVVGSTLVFLGHVNNV